MVDRWCLEPISISLMSTDENPGPDIDTNHCANPQRPDLLNSTEDRRDDEDDLYFVPTVSSSASESHSNEQTADSPSNISAPLSKLPVCNSTKASLAHPHHSAGLNSPTGVSGIPKLQPGPGSAAVANQHPGQRSSTPCQKSGSTAANQRRDAAQSAKASNQESSRVTLRSSNTNMRRRLPTERDDMASRVNRMSLDIQSGMSGRSCSSNNAARYEREHSAEFDYDRTLKHPTSPGKSATSTAPLERRGSIDNKSQTSSSNVGGSRGSYVSTPIPDCGVIGSKIGSLHNVKHKPAGGDVKIFNEKVVFKAEKGKCGTLENLSHKPAGGNVVILNEKVEIRAKSRIGSLNNFQHKPGGGNVKITNRKLDFSENATSRIGSLEYADHQPRGGSKRIYNEQLPWLKHNKPNLSEEEKLRINKRL